MSVRFAHASHSWNYSSGICRNCEVSAGSKAAAEPCAKLQPAPVAVKTGTRVPDLATASLAGATGLKGD